MINKSLKEEKAITLVALIITIIVLLILAIVSIRLVMNGGIIDRAEKGTKAYTEAEVEEKIKTAYAEYQMSKFQNPITLGQALTNSGLTEKTITGEGPWTITVGEKSYTLAVDGTVTPNTSGSSGSSTLTTNVAYTVGQEVTVGGENFYVLESSDASQDTVTLLAKYNLNQAGTAQAPNAACGDTACVFSNTNYWSSVHAIYYDSNDSGWDPCPRVVPSPPSSWEMSTWIKPYLDLNKESEYSFASSSGDAIYKAKAYATSKGGTNGRLLTYEEAFNLATNYSDIIFGTANQQGEGSSNHYLYYWLSSVKDNNSIVMYVSGSSNNFSESGYSNSSYIGVRTVVTASKSVVSLVQE